MRKHLADHVFEDARVGCHTHICQRCSRQNKATYIHIFRTDTTIPGFIFFVLTARETLKDEIAYRIQRRSISLKKETDGTYIFTAKWVFFQLRWNRKIIGSPLLVTR